MFSLTPPTRAESICTMSTAPAWRSCLKTTRLAMCSPVATLIGVDGLTDGGVAEDVVGGGGLLDPVRVVRRQRAHPVDRGLDVPALVGVDGDADTVTDRLTGGPHSAYVVLHIGTDLQLDLGEGCSQVRLVDQLV